MSGERRPSKFADGGMWSAMIYGGRIRPDSWERAKATGEVIGTCRACGGYLVPDDLLWPEESPIKWFTARCLDCGYEVAAPGGRVQRRHSRGAS